MILEIVIRVSYFFNKRRGMDSYAALRMYDDSRGQLRFRLKLVRCSDTSIAKTLSERDDGLLKRVPSVLIRLAATWHRSSDFNETDSTSNCRPRLADLELRV
jgi:hypothetical protein